MHVQQEIDSLVPAASDSRRRAFMRAGVGASFAAAVLPVAAQTVINTDSTGLDVGEVMIPVGDFGMPAYRAAPAGRQNAPVAWYGAVARSYVPSDATALDVAPRIKAAVLGLYGAADPGIPNDTVEKMRDALKAAGNTRSDFVLYPDTPHAFHADYRPSYRKDAADDGWKRCLAWFKTNGVV